MKPEDGTVRGEVVCPQAGLCVLRFENGSAMFSRGMRFSVGALHAHGGGMEGAAEGGEGAATGAATDD